MTTAESNGPADVARAPTGGQPWRRAIVRLSPAIALIFIALVVWRNHNALSYAYGSNPADHGDYNFLANAAHVISSDQARHLYNKTPPPNFKTIQGYNFPVLYPYAPAAALAMTPFRFFSYDTGYKAWRVFVALATICLAICIASAFRSWAWRAAMVVALVFWYPMLMNAHIGQTGAFISAFLAVSLLIYLRNQQAGAVLLGLLGVKPTAAIGPALFLVQEKPAVWLRFFATGTAIVLVPFIYLGPTQLWHWVQILRTRGWTDIAGGHSYNQGFSSIFGTSTDTGLVIAAILLCIAVLLVRLVHLRVGAMPAMAFALILGAMVNPHSLLYDWGAAFVAVLILRKSGLVPPDLADLALGLLAITLFVAGQFSFGLRHELGHGLRPLTVWALAVELVLLAIALLRLRAGLPALEPASGSGPSFGSGPSSGSGLAGFSLPRLSLPRVSVSMPQRESAPKPAKKASGGRQRQSRAERRRAERR